MFGCGEHTILNQLENNNELAAAPELITEKEEDVWRESFIAGSSVLLALMFTATSQLQIYLLLI